jgi:hypothetical protein
VQTVLKYDDNRQDKAGELARKLTEDLDDRLGTEPPLITPWEGQAA